MIVYSDRDVWCPVHTASDNARRCDKLLRLLKTAHPEGADNRNHDPQPHVIKKMSRPDLYTLQSNMGWAAR